MKKRQKKASREFAERDVKMKTKKTTIVLILCTLLLGQLSIGLGSPLPFRKGSTPFYIDFFGKEKPHQYPVKHTATLHKENGSSPVESQKGLIGSDNRIITNIDKRWLVDQRMGYVE